MSNNPNYETSQIVPDSLNGGPLYTYFASQPPDAVFKADTHAKFFPAGVETTFATLSFYSEAPADMEAILRVRNDPSIIPEGYSDMAPGERDPAEVWPLLISYILQEPVGGITYSEKIFQIADGGTAQAIGALLTPIIDTDVAELAAADQSTWGSFPCTEQLLMWSGDTISAAEADLTMSNMPAAYIQEIALTLVGEAASKMREAGLIPFIEL